VPVAGYRVHGKEIETARATEDAARQVVTYPMHLAEMAPALKSGKAGPSGQLGELPP
jgi:hypothetical protein